MLGTIGSIPRQFRLHTPAEINKTPLVIYACPECFHRIDVPHGAVATIKCPHCYEDGVVSVMKKQP